MSSLKKPIIAIDGYAACGKSTTAKLVAKKLGYIYVDTGAMYRSVTLYFLENNIAFDEETPQMREVLENIQIGFINLPDQDLPVVTLNGKIAEPMIREPRISNSVSQVSVHACVRTAMVREQRKLGKEGGVVMDGRDIGTYVFPHADLKIFMTASMDIRAQRRMDEYIRKGREISMEDVKANLVKRDHIDSTREIAPLKKADDAVVLDNSHMTIEEQVAFVREHALSVHAS